MKSIKIYFDESCPHCQETYEYFQFLQIKNPDAYASVNKKTGNYITPIKLRPDYNSAGVQTHWHLDCDLDLDLDGLHRKRVDE